MVGGVSWVSCRMYGRLVQKTLESRSGEVSISARSSRAPTRELVVWVMEARGYGSRLDL